MFGWYGPEGQKYRTGYSPGSGRPVSTMNQQGTGRGMEYHRVASGSRGPPTCRDHLLPVAPAGVVQAETEEARREEVMLSAATGHIQPDVIHQSSCMASQAWGPRGTGSRWSQKLPVASTQGAEGPHIIGEQAIGQLTTHQHQEASPGHGYMGVPGSL